MLIRHTYLHFYSRLPDDIALLHSIQIVDSDIYASTNSVINLRSSHTCRPWRMAPVQFGDPPNVTTRDYQIGGNKWSSVRNVYELGTTTSVV